MVSFLKPRTSTPGHSPPPPQEIRITQNKAKQAITRKQNQQQRAKTRLFVLFFPHGGEKSPRFRGVKEMALAERFDLLVTELMDASGLGESLSWSVWGLHA